jgi:poly-gamma-glutamate capsule biosynthesis protein CapA/YwtB (metallophosphatase superfamily)
MSKRLPGLLALLALALGSGVPAAASARQVPLGAYGGERTFRIALTGDAVLTQRLSAHEEPRFLGVIELLRGADLAFTNLETLFHDYEPSPAAQSGNLGLYLRAEPALARELAWAGIDLVSLANDHIGDYGEEGMRLTRRYVEAAGLLTAGTGEDLREAREARFVETHDGRVAFVATASAFTAHSRAGPARGGVRGRPGLSPLRFQGPGPRPMPRDDLERLRATLRAMGVDDSDRGEDLNAFGVRLVEGEEGSRSSGPPNATDLAEISAVVRNAAALSDYVVLSVHAHEQDAYLRTFAHAAIDAGADILVGHGPHTLGGIEIYRGRPIFYSLGDFVFQDETILRQPADAYTRYGLGPDATLADFNAARTGHETSDFESVVAIPTFESGRLTSIELHPITLGADGPPQARGRPMLADREQGRRIVQRLSEMSRPYGTVIEWQEERGIGIVRVPRADDS